MIYSINKQMQPKGKTNMKSRKRIVSSLVVLLLLLPLPLGCAQRENVVTLEGTVVEIEEFGHAVLDIAADAFYGAGFALGDMVSVQAGRYRGDMACFSGYYADAGETMLRAAPDDANIALCINYGNFAETAVLEIGDAATITLKEKGAALATQELLSMEYSDDREDYGSDEMFSNFRPIELGTIGEGKLYRSASPINDERSRASVTNALTEHAEINTIVNMADSEEEIAQHISADEFDSGYYRVLWEKGNVIALGMSADFRSDDFAEKLIAGLRFIAQNEGPYLIHCNEGKDRTGFACMLIEMLMGAGLRGIIDDYMLSYQNYYGVSATADANKYELILENNLIEMLYFVTEAEDQAALDAVDLSAAAERWLLSRGMEKAAVEMLKRNLQ